MNDEDQRFMALEGLHAWALAAHDAIERHRRASHDVGDPVPGRRFTAMRRMRSEIHLFLIAAHKFLEHGDWAKELAFLDPAFLNPIEPYRHEIKLLRDKNEHVIEYFKGRGRFPADWIHHEPEGSADASSLNGTKIGGRLDYTVVCEAMTKITETVPEAYWPSP